MTIHIKQAEGHSLPIELPFYYKIYGAYITALRATAEGKIRRIFIDVDSMHMSVTEFSSLPYLDQEDCAKVLRLEPNFLMIQEREFITALDKTINELRK